MTLYHEVEGGGPTVAFVHEGIVDSRVWDPQWSSFEAYRRIRFDLHGFGRTPVGSLPLTHARDVIELLDGLGVSGAALIGGSMGGRVALEIAIDRPISSAPSSSSEAACPAWTGRRRFAPTGRPRTRRSRGETSTRRPS